MRKILNFRPFVVIALIMAASVLSALVAFNIAPLGISFLVILGVFSLSAAVIFFVKRDVTKGVTFTLALLFSALAAMFFFVTEATRFGLNDGQTYIISGRVTEYYGADGEDYVFTIDSLTANENEADGKMRVYLEGGAQTHDFLQCGYTVTFETTVYQNTLIDGFDVNASGIRNGVRYNAYPEQLYTLSPGQAEGLESVRLRLKSTLDESMDEDAASVAYGMIIGDRHYLSDDISDYFAASGIGHILAVSGLHIGVLTAALAFLLKLIRVPRAASPFIIMAVLIMYAVLTGGSPSVIRACVMCFIMLLSPFFGRRDLLNSLCAAAVVCLLISPYYLFEAGFIMSFSAVFGLATLAPPLARLFKRLRLHKFISSPLSASLAVQIAIIPATAYFFHAFYTYSLLVNVVMLPLLSWLYIGLLAALVLTLIIPAASILLTAVGFLIGGMCAVCFFVSVLPAASVVVHSSRLAFLVMPAMFLASDFVMSGKRLKLAMRIFAAAVICACPLYADNTFYAADSLVAMNRGGTVIFGDNTYLVGNISDNIVSILLNARIRGNLYVYPGDMNDQTAVNIIELNKTYKVMRVFAPDYENVGGVRTLLDAGINVKLTNYESDFSAAYVNGVPRGWLYTSNGRTAYITTGYSGGAPDYAADVVRCKAAYSTSEDKLYLTHHRREEEISNIHSNTLSGNIVYSFADAKVYSY